jgi:hypothetical protein
MGAYFRVLSGFALCLALMGPALAQTMPHAITGAPAITDAPGRA